MLQQRWVLGLTMVLGAAICASLLESCKSKDLEFVEPFEFVLPDLEPPDIQVELEAPVVAEPTVPTITVPNQAQQQTSQLAAAATPQDVPTAVQNSLDAASNIASAAGVSASDVNSFDQNDFTAISSTPVDDLNSSILAAGQAAAQNPVLTSLFPSLSAPSGRFASAPGANQLPDVLEPMQPFEEVTGPCADRARDLFEQARAALLQIKADKESEVNAFFTPLYSDLNSRQASRNGIAADSLTVRISRLNTLVASMLTTADRFTNNGDQASIDLAFQIRSLAVIYYIYTYSLIRGAYDSTVTINETAKNNEKADLDAAKQNALDFILAKFNETQAKYEAALAKGLEDCHNQGGGN